MSYIFTWNVHVIFETYSIQTKIGTYFKNKFVHDLNEYKLFRKTKKKNGCKKTKFNMKYLPILPNYLKIHFPVRPKKLLK